MERLGAVARADEANGSRERKRPSRDRERQLPNRVKRPGIRVFQGDGVACTGGEDHWLAGNPSNQCGQCDSWPPLGRDLGRVALRVGGGGSHHGLVCRRGVGNVEKRLAPGISSDLKRSQVLLGLAEKDPTYLFTVFEPK